MTKKSIKDNCGLFIAWVYMDSNRTDTLLFTDVGNKRNEWRDVWEAACVFKLATFIKA